MRNWMVLVALVAAVNAPADSLFSQKVADRGTLISDTKLRFEEGDIIIVLVEEQTDATTESETETEKESEISANAPIAANPFFVGNGENGNNILNPGELPNWDFDVENEFEGEGETARNNSFTTTIGCIVTKVFDNGNIEIEGKKTIQVNREDTTIELTGLVRGRDVSPTNTIMSTEVANAKIKINGQGPLWNNERRGWFARALDWISPF